MINDQKPAPFSGIYPHLSNQSWKSVLILIILIAAIMIPVYSYRVLNPVNSDFGSHTRYALHLLRGENIPDFVLAHPLYAVFIGAILWVTRTAVDADHASIVIMVASQVVTALIIYFWLGSRKGKFSELVRVLLSAGLVIAAPIMVLEPLDKLYYFGYIGQVNFHNPTVTLLRPFALLVFILTLELLGHESLRWRWILPGWILVIASSLVKPNFTLALLPAIGIIVVIRALRGEWKRIWPVVLGVVLPGVLILVCQYLVGYMSGKGGGTQIIFAPLVVESGASGYLPVKFVLSLFFPLLVLGVERRDLFNSENQLSWLILLVGVAQLYLLAETGNRLDDGNFRWGAQIALFLVFVTTTRYIWKKPACGRKEVLALTVGLIPHVAAGVIYWLHCLSSKGYG
jgi:hypothetical protein